MTGADRWTLVLRVRVELPDSSACQQLRTAFLTRRSEVHVQRSIGGDCKIARQMTGLTRHAGYDGVRRSGRPESAGWKSVSHDRHAHVGVEEAIVQRDAGIPAAAKSLDDICASIAVCVA